MSSQSPWALACILALTSTAHAAPKPGESADKPFRVVIDPGHGGGDEGAKYDNGSSSVTEKDATLLLAQQVARQLRAAGITVVLTRNDDTEISLGDRTALANRLGANVFLSIHMNSTQTPMVSGAEGVETYILNNTTDASSKRLAVLENTVIAHDANETPQAMDVALILRDLRLDANLSESKRLACTLQDRLLGATRTATRRSRQRNRGVKQSLFHVLLGAEMPSVLVEAGFLSNAVDRAMILNPGRRRAMAGAIARAVEDFRDTRGTAAAARTLSKCKIH